MLGIAFFSERKPSYTLATETGKFFCGKNDKTFTDDVEEAYFFNTPEEAEEGLKALNKLLKEEEKMSTTTTATATMKERPKDAKEIKPDFGVIIRNMVVNILGKPKDFIKADAINVYDNRWRVNIWAKGPNGAKISDTFFIKFTDGQIISSDPPLNVKYE